MQRLGMLLVGPDSPPQDLRGNLVLRDSHHKRPVIKRGDEQLLSEERRITDPDRHSRRWKRVPPEDLATPRIQARQTIASPTDQHVLIGLANQNRGGISPPILEGPPDLLARLFVESDHTSTPCAAYLLNHQVLVDQRRGGNAPDGHLDIEVLLQIPFPDHCTGLGIQAVEMPHRTNAVSFSLVDRHAGARTGRVADSVVGSILDDPQRFASLGVETVDTFGRVAIFRLPVHDIDTPHGDGRSRVTWTDLSGPSVRQLARRKLLDDTGFPPEAIASWTSPLGPIIAKNPERNRSCPSKRDDGRTNKTGFFTAFHLQILSKGSRAMRGPASTTGS